RGILPEDRPKGRVPVGGPRDPSPPHVRSSAPPTDLHSRSMRTSVDVHNYLVERDVRHELFTVRGRLRTPERLAAVLELPPEQVGKITVYESEEGPVLAVVASDREPDPERVRKALQARERVVASPGRASALADYL